MTDEIVITTGARLHFGFLALRRSFWDLHGKSVNLDNDPRMREPRSYGGAGLMIDSPGFVVAVSPSEADQFAVDWPQEAGFEPVAGRVADFVRRYRRACRPRASVSACRVEIRRALFSHRGLGSGTQLGMALATALARLANETGASAADPRALAQRVSRGNRSAIGIHGFARGGFLVDGGKCREESVAPLVARADVPAAWRFLLVWPVDVSGKWGRAELAAFARLPEMPFDLSGKLCRLVLLEMLPALAEADFERFGAALFEYGTAVGKFFQPVQGGEYADPTMAALVKWIHARHVTGVAQTSWGPTIAACCPDSATADSLRREILADDQWSRCQTHVAAPLNAGASISVAPREPPT